MAITTPTQGELDALARPVYDLLLQYLGRLAPDDVPGWYRWQQQVESAKKATFFGSGRLPKPRGSYTGGLAYTGAQNEDCRLSLDWGLREEYGVLDRWQTATAVLARGRDHSPASGDYRGYFPADVDHRFAYGVELVVTREGTDTYTLKPPVIFREVVAKVPAAKGLPGNADEPYPCTIEEIRDLTNRLAPHPQHPGPARIFVLVGAHDDNPYASAFRRAMTLRAAGQSTVQSRQADAVVQRQVVPAVQVAGDDNRRPAVHRGGSGNPAPHNTR